MILARAALLWMLAALPAAAECVMSVRLDEDPPYLMTLPDGRPAGVNVDVVREALRRMGCKADFRTMPFIRALRALRTGELNILPNAFRSPERETFVLYSRTLSRVPNRLFVRTADKDRWAVASLGDVPRLGIRLGLAGWALTSPDFASFARDPAFKAMVTTAPSQDGLLRMLQAGRVDAVILDEVTARWELRRLGFADAAVGTDFITVSAPSYFAFSRATVSAEQARGFDDAVSDMRKDGAMAEILARYGFSPDAAIDISE